MLRAIIFDCDGVIADTEPIHLSAFRKTLEEDEIVITDEEYFENYLGLDDRACFKRAFEIRGLEVGEAKVEQLLAAKAAYTTSFMREELRLFPGVEGFIRNASMKYPLAVATSALRREVELVLELTALRDMFKAVITAEDVARSKPDPEPYLKALEALNRSSAQSIKAADCLVIEDSARGVRSARGAGMRAIAVTNTCPAEQLAEADHIINSIESLSLSDVESLFQRF
ncbi:MAG TPA: HAD family phosphatase [Blastocatellia bacterium]|nr:HAD family phosphatase [Blastocatellia bacterium]